MMKKINLKTLKGILSGNVMLTTLNNECEEEILYTSENFKYDNNVPDELWNMNVDTIYSQYYEGYNVHYTVVWLT